MASHVGTLVGLGAAGIWGYFNFVRSRTYYPRMEMGAEGDIRSHGDQRYLVPRITLKNIGNSKIELIQHGTGYKVWFTDGSVDDEGELIWSGGKLTYSMLVDHKWIEPGESIFDEKSLIPLPQRCVATKVQARLVAPIGWPQRTNTVWKCSVIIGPLPKSGKDDKGNERISI